MKVVAEVKFYVQTDASQSCCEKIVALTSDGKYNDLKF